MLMLHEDHAHEGASRDTIDTWHASLIPTSLQQAAAGTLA